MARNSGIQVKKTEKKISEKYSQTSKKSKLRREIQNSVTIQRLKSEIILRNRISRLKAEISD